MKKRKRRNEFEIWKLIRIKIVVLPTGIRSLVVKASARQAEDLGSYPSECQIFSLLRFVLSSLLPLRNIGRSNFDKGLHNFITLIKKRHQIRILLYCIMESTVDSNEQYIYIVVFDVDVCLILHVTHSFTYTMQYVRSSDIKKMFLVRLLIVISMWVINHSVDWGQFTCDYMLSFQIVCLVIGTVFFLCVSIFDIFPLRINYIG